MSESSVDLSGIEVHHLGQYFGIWAMADQPFLSAFEMASRMDLRAHILEFDAAAARREVEGGYRYELLDNGVAVVSLSGPMTKYWSSMSGGTSTALMRRTIRNAASDGDVKAILLRIDSPDGMVAGNKDLADDVAAAAKKKPVVAFIEDLGASAAYWVASQASRIYTNAMGMVGSIGTYGVIYDMSGAAAMQGVKALVFRSGKFKGMGTPGTEITDDQKAEFQRQVDELNSFFLDAVSTGRKMDAEKVKDLADGRVHIGAEALKLGLVDGVQSWEQTLSMLGAELSVSGGESKSRRNTAMAEQTEPKVNPEAAPKVASYEDLVATCPGADEKFICGQLKVKATVEQARTAWMQTLAEGKAAAEKRASEAEEKVQAAGKKVGVEPLTSTAGKGAASGSAGSATDRWNAAVKEVRENLKCDEKTAVLTVVRKDPDLHAEYIAEVNAKRNQG